MSSKVCARCGHSKALHTEPDTKGCGVGWIEGEQGCSCGAFVTDITTTKVEK